jgi:hypothetical protein
VTATRNVILSFLAVAAAATLAGCSLLLPSSQHSPAPSSSAPSSSAPSQATAAQPTIGQCWNGTIKDAGDWADWSGSSATACGRSHTLYTYGVGHVTGLQPTDWAVSASNPALRDDVAAAASKTCDAPYAKLLPTLPDASHSLLRVFFFVPSRAEWKQGARWVRCDLALLDFGTSTAHERFAPLPASISTLTDAVVSDPLTYAMCLDTDHSTAKGPFADSSDVITDCRNHPEWLYAQSGLFTQAANAPYPTSKELSARVSAVCSAQLMPTEVWSAYYPTPATWKSGDRAIECWAGFKDWTPGGGNGTNA